MIVTSSIALMLIAFNFLIGCLIGFVTVALLFRSRLRLKVALLGAVTAGLAFLLMIGLAGWADSREEFSNGKRQDVTSWGEHLWLRNRIAQYQIPLAFGASTVAALLVGFHSRSRLSDTTLASPPQ